MVTGVTAEWNNVHQVPRAVFYVMCVHNALILCLKRNCSDAPRGLPGGTAGESGRDLLNCACFEIGPSLGVGTLGSVCKLTDGNGFIVGMAGNVIAPIGKPIIEVLGGSVGTLAGWGEREQDNPAMGIGCSGQLDSVMVGFADELEFVTGKIVQGRAEHAVFSRQGFPVSEQLSFGDGFHGNGVFRGLSGLAEDLCCFSHGVWIPSGLL